MHSRARAAVPLAALAVLALLVTAMTGGAATTPPTVNVADASGNNVMDPSSTTIKTGDSVKFHWNESGHNVHFQNSPEGDIDLGYHSTGYEVSHTFTQPGTYKFVCDSHSKMTGTITVSGAPVQPQQDTTPPAADAPQTTDPQPTTGAPAASSTDPPAATASAASAGTGAATTAAPSDAGPPTARFRAVKGTLTVEASEPVRLFLRAVRLGARGHRVYKRTLDLRRGANKVYLRDWLWGKRYRLELTAVDADRNAIKPVRMRIAIR